MKYTAFVVSHTHWDREWYLPFQGLCPVTNWPSLRSYYIYSLSEVDSKKELLY